jgi:hypothetical protein
VLGVAAEGPLFAFTLGFLWSSVHEQSDQVAEGRSGGSLMLSLE